MRSSIKTSFPSDRSVARAWAHAENNNGVPQPARSIRLPGLFRFSEVAEAIGRSGLFHLVKAGTSRDGDALFAVYCREG